MRAIEMIILTYNINDKNVFLSKQISKYDVL